MEVFRNLQLVILKKSLVFILDLSFSLLTSTIKFQQQESARGSVELHSIHQWVLPCKRYRNGELEWDVCPEFLLGLFSVSEGDRLMEKVGKGMEVEVSLSEYRFCSAEAQQVVRNL